MYDFSSINKYSKDKYSLKVSRDYKGNLTMVVSNLVSNDGIATIVLNNDSTEGQQAAVVDALSAFGFHVPSVSPLTVRDKKFLEGLRAMGIKSIYGAGQRGEGHTEHKTTVRFYPPNYGKIEGDVWVLNDVISPELYNRLKRSGKLVIAELLEEDEMYDC